MKKKPTKEESLSALANDIAAVCLKYRDLTFEEIVESYRIIERTALARVSDNQFLALETRRRVAEQLVYAAIYKDRAWEEARVLLDELLRLGFTNIEVKVFVLQIYSKYCLKIARSDEGIALLAPLETELATKFNRKDLTKPARRFYSIELQRTRALLNKLRAASTN